VDEALIREPGGCHGQLVNSFGGLFGFSGLDLFAAATREKDGQQNKERQDKVCHRGIPSTLRIHINEI
jgi:hypothetical protein